MLLAPLIAPVLSFIFRDVAVKFFVFTSVFALVAFLVPKVVAFLAPYIGVSRLTDAFLGLPGGVWFFLDAFNFPAGVPLLISAWVTRFLIRRMPVIG